MIEVLPRLAAFPLVRTSPVIPAGGEILVQGDLIAADKPIAAYGTLARRTMGELSLDAAGGIDASSWFAYNVDLGSAAVRVRAATGFRRSRGTDLDDVRLGVMARMKNAGGGSATTLVRWWAADAYMFDLTVDVSAQTYVARIRRVNQGVLTDLATSATLPIDVSKTYELELDVAGSAAVLLFGRVNGQTVVNVGDASASRITGSGLVGFLLQNRTTGQNKTESWINELDVVAPGNTVLLADRFDRPNKAATVAQWLPRLWHDPTPITVENNAGAGRIRYNLADRVDSSLYQVRPRGTEYAVEMAATFIGTNGTLGLIVRGSRDRTGADLSGLTGYLVTLSNPGGTSQHGAIIRCTLGELAVLRPFSTTLSLTGEFLFRVRTYIDAKGRVQIRVALNDEVVATVADGNSRRILSAGQVGMQFSRPAAEPAILVSSFELFDDGPAALPAALPLLGEAYPEQPIATSPFKLAANCPKIAAQKFELGFVPYAGAEDVRVTVGGARLRPRTVAGSPTASEFIITAGNDIDLGFDPGTAPVVADVITAAGSNMRLNRLPLVSGTTVTVPAAFVAGTLRLCRETYELANVTVFSGRGGEFRETSSTTAELSEAPVGGEIILADYEVAEEPGHVTNERLSQLLDGNRSFTVAGLADPARASLIVDGSRLWPRPSGAPSPGEFRIDGNTWVLGFAPSVGAHLRAHYERLTVANTSLPIAPSFAVEVAEKFLPRREMKFDGGAIQTSPRSATKRRHFRVRWEYLNKADGDLLKAFFDGRRGPLRQITWTPPDDSIERMGIVAEANVNRSKVNPDVYRADALIVDLVVP